jgi:hypothetical protein
MRCLEGVEKDLWEKKVRDDDRRQSTGKNGCLQLRGLWLSEGCRAKE